ncbi:cytochrome P450 2F1 [Sapajus apella]|uniref:Cytochrome P450 2F1 n=1 Tax=Sapajus apella TaxID=9515 RepID=A0A6J3FFV4_SAPAP|nr:cytochrome P450 2F1 [Sapajus apella]
MDSISTAMLLLLLALVCLLLTLSSRDKGKLPPGPRPLPVLGNLLLLRSQDMLTSLTELSKEYGSMYTMYLGSRRVVVLSGLQAVKEALADQGEEFSGHGDHPVFFFFTKGNGNIAFCNGDRWKILRHFSIQVLRSFGMEKASIEERILEGGSFLLTELRKTEGEPFNPTFVLSRSVSNIICSLLFGSRFHYEDDRLLTIVCLINDNLQLMSSPWDELYIFPSLLDWVPGPHRRIFQNFKCLRDLIAHSVHDHQASLDPRSPRDFIDCFLTKMTEEEEDPQSHFHMDTLLMTTHNLLFGGPETVGTTLCHAFLALMKYPKVQARVQEIDLVVGRARLPALEDRAAMPYTDAVIHEVQRFADSIPVNLPHRVTRDTAFRGFLIPEGTDVITLLNTVHHDPSQILMPQEFNPEHFPGANQSFKKSPAFMPFSAGRRLCLGESLARKLFLFLTAILQSFSLQPLGAPEDIDLTPLSSGLGNLLRPFQLCLRAR